MDRYERIGLTALRLAGLLMIAGTLVIWIRAGLFDGCDEALGDRGDQGRGIFLVMLGTSPLGVAGALAVAWSLWWHARATGRPALPWRLFAWLLRAGLWLGGLVMACIALAAPGEVGPLALAVSPFCGAVAFGAFWAGNRLTRTLKAAPEH